MIRRWIRRTRRWVQQLSRAPKSSLEEPPSESSAPKATPSAAPRTATPPAQIAPEREGPSALEKEASEATAVPDSPLETPKTDAPSTPQSPVSPVTSSRPPSLEECQAILASPIPSVPWATGDIVEVYAHSRGNVFMRDLALLWASGLEDIGMEVRLKDESSTSEVPPDHRLFIAPHEFFYIPRNDGSIPFELGRGAVMYEVEQLHTLWFGQAKQALDAASAIFDISLESAAELRRRGYPARYLPPGFSARCEPFGFVPELPDDPALKTLEPAIRRAKQDISWADRPIDVLFLGHLSERRGGVIARLAPSLARRRCHWTLTDGREPLVEQVNAPLSSRGAVGLAQRSKLVLNIHQSERPYFEAHRLLLHGFWQRALVLTEPLPAVPDFQPGEHFLEVPLEEWPEVISWLLDTPDGRSLAERVTATAHDHFVRRHPFGETIRRSLS